VSCRKLNIVGILVIAAIVVGLPVAYASYQRANHRNIRVVTPGVLYRSGQLSQSGLQRLIHDYGIHTVISLRDSGRTTDVEGAPPPDAAEADYCRSLDINHVRITPKSWWPEYDGPPPAEQGIAKFLKVMDDPANRPVLLHCYAGTHRTGAMVCIYRMEYDRWTNSEALAELRGSGYKNLDKETDVLSYLENYRPRRMK
jgi:tyrosine-protein phosphatase SIW14